MTTYIWLIAFPVILISLELLSWVPAVRRWEDKQIKRMERR